MMPIYTIFVLHLDLRSVPVGNSDVILAADRDQTA